MTSLFDLPFEEPEPDEPAQPQRPQAPYTVSGLTSALRDVIDGAFGVIAVEGEVSNCRTWTTGHIYFTLKDELAQLRAVVFRTTARQLKFALQDGLHVVVRGRLGVYEQKGEYQIVCDRIEPLGRGALQLAFEQLKRRLAAEGLFDESRKRPLPALPRKIGIVTSIDGAALRDIITVLRTRYPSAHLVIRPARVQGDGAAVEVARALAAIARVPHIDVVILGRGGGSIEDLWAFNEEIVARAIVKCPIPVISAVGHETDFTIADFVADRRAPTPSAAAALVAQAHTDLRLSLARSRERLVAATRRRVLMLRGRVHGLAARPALSGWPTHVALTGRHVAELTHTLRRTLGTRIAAAGRRVDLLDRRLEARDLRRRISADHNRVSALRTKLDTLIARDRHLRQRRLGATAARLEALSPLAVLARGYALCWDVEQQTLVRRAVDVSPGDQIRVSLSEGSIEAAVLRTEPAN
jgi:exodeoxyribonuclease VII large subunit